MAKVQGVKEKLHSPIYDAFFVPGPGLNNSPPARKFSEAMTDPRMIRFFVDVQNKTKLETNLQASGVLPSNNDFEARAMRVVVSSLKRFVPTSPKPRQEINEAEVLADLLYNSVTTLIVGEKIMIEMPTYFFPAGAGPSPSLATVTNGTPDPMATFRFAGSHRAPTELPCGDAFSPGSTGTRIDTRPKQAGGCRRANSYLGCPRRLPHARCPVTDAIEKETNHEIPK
jgi:hypothetical protein